MGRLQDKIAVITGGTRGIGLASALAMAREGAMVVVCSRKEPGVQAATQAINEAFPGRCVGKVLHVGKLETIPAFWDEVVAQVGTPNVLMNNAGTNPHFGPMLSVEWGAWDKTFEVNVKGPFEMTRQLVQRLDGRPGSVINVSSILGARAALFQGVYGCTKASIISMTKTLAVEFGEFGVPVRVNSIAPGMIETRLSAALSSNPAMAERVMRHTPLKRFGLPEEVAEMAVFLASDEASFVTGTTLFADGGYTAD